MDYLAIMIESENAAAKAAEEWLTKANARGPAFSVHDGNRCVGHMLDVCGFAWLEFNDKRSAFYKWCKNKVNETSRYPERTLYRVPIDGAYSKWRCHQEMGMKEDAMRAARGVFASHGIIVRFCSRID